MPHSHGTAPDNGTLGFVEMEMKATGFLDNGVGRILATGSATFPSRSRRHR
jgi:hypothetical protein